MLAIGLMSGTSMDGIDAAIIETDGKFEIKEIYGVSISYDYIFQMILKSVEYSIKKHKDIKIAEKYYQLDSQEYFNNRLAVDKLIVQKIKDYNLDSIKAIEEFSARLHIEIIEKLLHESGVNISAIDVIGYHGQTMYHAPNEKKSIILAAPELISARFNVRVICHFRDADINNNGQGAPFAPLYHYALAMRDNLFPVAVVNCGGIANVTIIPNQDIKHVLGFDTGPGNVMIDNFVRRKTNGKMQMDLDGDFGMLGIYNQDVIDILYKKSTDNYYKKSFPKSLDVNDIKIPDEIFDLSLEDGCRNLAAFTACTIFESVAFSIDKWILVGGGWYNKTILSEFTKLAKGKVMFANELGWDNKFLEAQIFAYLAVRKLLNLPASYPNTTNCSFPTVAGVIYV